MSLHVDQPIDTRVKLCALWTSIMFCSIYTALYRLYIPGALEQMRALGANPEFQTSWLLIGIPILMIFLSVALPAVYNRVLNIVVGVVLVLLSASKWMFVAQLSTLPNAPATSPLPIRVAANSIEAGIAVFAALVVWYAWTWPRKPNAA